MSLETMTSGEQLGEDFRMPFKITAKHASRYKISRNSGFNIWILKKGTIFGRLTFSF